MFLLTFSLAGINESIALDVLSPTFEGRPFVVIEGPRAFTNGYVTIGVAGDRWRWLAVTPDGRGVQLLAERGGGIEATTSLGPIEVSSGIPLSPNTGPAALGVADRDPQAPLTDSAFVFVAGQERNGIYFWDGTNTTSWLAPYAPLPGVADAVVDQINAIAYAQGQVAIAAEFIGSGVASGLRTGIFRVPRGGPLKVVADSAYALPGNSSDVRFSNTALAFDGRTLLFKAGFGASKPWFIQVDENAPVEAFAPAGTVLPNGAALARVDEVRVFGGRVYLTAEDSKGIGYLLRWEAGAWTILVREGDRSSEGGMVTGLGQAQAPLTRSPVGAGLALDGARLYFGAQIAGKAAVAYLEAGTIRMAIGPGTRFPYEPYPLDVEPLWLSLNSAQDGVVVAVVQYAPNKFNLPERDFHWVATLPRPAKPLILEWPTNTTVASPGAPVEWEAKVAGDAPFTYQLSGPHGVVPPIAEGRWRFDSVSLTDAGDYQLTVTNAAGLARAPRLRLTVPAPPVLTRVPTSQTLRLGNPLLLEAEAVGGPEVLRYWLHDQTPVPSSSSEPTRFTLSWPKMSLAEVGWYSAVAQNAYGAVTSAPVHVTMVAEPSTATWAGRPLVLAAQHMQPTEPFGYRLSLYGTDSLRTRWLGGSLWWSSVYVLQNGLSSWGLFRTEGHQTTLVLGANVSLPSSLGNALTLGLVETALESDPLSVLASTRGSAFGLYRLEGLRLMPWLETTTPPPAAADGTPDAWVRWDGVYQSGERFALTATTSRGASLFRVENGQATRWLDLTALALPEVTGPISLSTPGFDGRSAAVVLNGPPTFQGVPGVRVEVAADGSYTKRLAFGSAIEGTTNRVGVLGATVVRDGTLYAEVWDELRPNRMHLLSWEGGRVRRLAGPGSPVRGGGALLRPYAMRLETGGQRIVVGASYERDGLTDDGLFIVQDDGLERIVSGQEFGLWNIGNLLVADLAGDRLAFVSGSGVAGFFVNTSDSSDSLATLTVLPGEPGHLHLGAQPRALLEWAPTAVGPWSILSEHGSAWEVPITEANGFFRSRRP